MNRRCTTLAAATLITGLAAAAVSCSTGYDTPTPATTTTTEAPTTTIDTTGVTLTDAPLQATTVAKIVDGDTLDVAGGRRIRVIGVDTPERGDCGFNEATAALTALIPAGTVVYLIPDQSDKDRYGRYLFYVERGSDRLDVGGQLVADGHAVSYPYAPDTARSPRYDQLEQQARATGQGQWGACPR